MAGKYTGRCACGAITFAFDTDPQFIANCHCNDCKRASGGEMATFFGVPESDFTLLSGSPKPFHYVANSGKGLDRNFCLTADPAYSRAIWKASRRPSSSSLGASTIPN